MATSIIVLYCRCQQTVEKVAGFNSCETSFFLHSYNVGSKCPCLRQPRIKVEFSLYDANKYRGYLYLKVRQSYAGILSIFSSSIAKVYSIHFNLDSTLHPGITA